MYVIHEEIETGRSYKPFGVIYLKNNGCCPGKPIALTISSAGAISAQCVCGGWCTNGHKTATAAVKEYEHMNKGRGIWDHARVGEWLKELERSIQRMDNWDEPTAEEIERARELYGDD